MGFGIFGKLPQKRDFVAIDIPYAVLNPFETWLQSAVAASRSELGRQWEERYLVAPIWRFWVGHGVFGQLAAGALMPSVDKVGRFFPLSIIYTGASGEESAPPPIAPRDAWYETLEARLLTALDEEAATPPESLASGLPAFDRATELRPAGSAPFEGVADFMSGLVQSDYWSAAATRSFWWTAGGGGGEPIAHASAGLPDPYFFSRMVMTTQWQAAAG